MDNLAAPGFNRADGSSDSILVVDDDPLGLRLLKELLQGSGHICQTANSADEAIGVLEECHPRLIVTDWRMPGVDGVAFARLVRRFRPEVTIVLLTGELAEAVASITESSPFDAVLSKPLNLTQLLAIVEPTCHPTKESGRVSLDF